MVESSKMMIDSSERAEKVITCSVLNHPSQLMEEETEQKCTSCGIKKKDRFYSCGQEHCIKKKTAYNCQDCADTMDYTIKSLGYVGPVKLSQVMPECMKGKEDNFICYFCTESLKGHKEWYQCLIEMHLKFKRGFICLTCAKFMRTYTEKPYQADQAPIDFLEQATQDEIVGGDLRLGKPRGFQDYNCTIDGIDKRISVWMDRFKSKEPFYGDRKNLVPADKVYGIVIVNDEFSEGALPTITTGGYQEAWAKYFLQNISANDDQNIRCLRNKNHEEIINNLKAVTIKLMKAASDPELSKEKPYIKPVVFLMTQGYCDEDATHHVIDDKETEKSLINVEFYMKALSQVAIVVRVAHTYKIPEKVLTEFNDKLKAAGVEESKKVTNTNYLRFSSNYHQKQTYFLKNVIDNFISHIEDDETLTIEPIIADQAQKNDVALCETTFDLDVSCCLKVSPMLRTGFQAIFHTDFFLDLPHISGRKARQWHTQKVCPSWVPLALFGDPDDAFVRQQLTKKEITADLVTIINRMVARLAVQDAMRTANQTVNTHGVFFSNSLFKEQFETLRKTQKQLQGMRKDCISEFLTLKTNDYKQYIESYAALIEETFDCLIHVVLKKAWIKEEDYFAIAGDLNGDKKSLIQKELENITKCTDIQRHVITAILSGKDVQPSYQPPNPFHVGSLSQADDRLPETVITHKIALLIGVQQYDNLADSTGERYYSDINQASTDIHVMHHGLTQMGFKDDEIKVLWNPTYKAVNTAVTTIFKFLRKKKNEAVFLFVYFTGHGESDDKQTICLNDPDGGGKQNLYRFRLDEKFRAILNLKPHFGLVMYDCCRTKFAKTDLDATSLIKTGNPLQTEFNYEEPKDKELDKASEAIQLKNNFVFIYSCPPSAGVPARSAVARFVMYYLSTQVQEDNKLWFPGAFRQYKGHDGQTECNIKVNCKFSLQLEPDSDFVKYSGIFNILDNPDFPVAKNVFQDIIYDTENEKNAKLISTVICKLFNNGKFQEFMEQNQNERFGVLEQLLNNDLQGDQRNDQIEQYAQNVVKASNRLNKDARELFYNTSAYLHFEDRHALNTAFYAMLGTKDKEDKLTTIMCSHADQEPMELNLDILRSLKKIQTILFAKLQKKKEKKSDFARKIAMVESQLFYFDENILVFDMMREHIIKAYGINDKKLGKFRLRVTNLLEAIYTEEAKVEGDYNRPLATSATANFESKINDVLQKLENDQSPILQNKFLDTYIDSFAKLLEPSKLKVSVVKIDFGHINLNRAATTYRFTYQGKNQYVPGNYPEKFVEFDLQCQKNDVERDLVVTVLYREGTGKEKEESRTVDIGSVKFNVKKQFVDGQPCIHFTETVYLNPVKKMNEYLRYRTYTQGEGLFSRIQGAIKYKNGEIGTDYIEHHEPTIDLHFQVMNSVPEDKQPAANKVEEKKELAADKVEEVKKLVECPDVAAWPHVKDGVLDKQGIKFIEPKDNQVPEATQYGSPVSQEIFEMYKAAIMDRKERIIDTFSIYGSRDDVRMTKIKQDVDDLVNKVNGAVKGLDANTINADQFLKYYSQDKPQEEQKKEQVRALEEFANFDLDKNGTAEKWEIIQYRSKPLVEEFKADGEPEKEYNQLLKAVDDKIKDSEEVNKKYQKTIYDRLKTQAEARAKAKAEAEAKAKAKK